MFLENNIWFHPVNIIYHFKRLEKSGELIPGTNSYKKAAEAYVTAISLIGLTKILNKDFWLQIVSDEEQSPDIRTGCYHKLTRDNDFSYQDVEVVTYEQHSKMDLIDFLCNTKLSKQKAYDDLTTILCHINKITLIPSWIDLNQTLLGKKLKTKSPVMIIGKSHPEKEIYKIIQIYPTIDLQIEFDLLNECKKINQKEC